MERRLSISRVVLNLVLSMLFALIFAPTVGANIVGFALCITFVSVAVEYFVPSIYKGIARSGLQTEVWVTGIKENPVPDNSFIMQSVDMSQYVENNKLHLAEAGIEPNVHEDYFATSNNPLPFTEISDIENEVVLKTYSTEQTRHRQLQEIELNYDKRSSVIDRHRKALAKLLGKTAAYAWTPSQDNEFNKIVKLNANDSIIDGIIDLKAFLEGKDIFEGVNLCLTAEHLARIRKEDKKLYKDILNEKQMYGINIFQYSQNPLFTQAGVKKPFGATKDTDDRQASFLWVTDEVFRCFGSVELYANLRDSGIQADTLSFAQRALVGVIRARNPKYLGAII